MGAFSLIVVINLLNRLCNWAHSLPRTYILSRMGRTLHQKSLKRAKAERVKNRLEKLEAVQKAKDEGTYIAKPWENRPLLQELYSFAIKTHKTKKASQEEGDGESVSGDSIMDLDLRSPGTPRSLEEDEVETGSVTSKDDRSSLTSHSSHSSKYSLKNIEKQLLQKMKGGAAVPDWLTKKERKRVYRNIQRVRKIKQTTRYKRIKRKLQAKENSKMDQSPSSKQSTSSSSSSAAKCASKSEVVAETS